MLCHNWLNVYANKITIANRHSIQYQKIIVVTCHKDKYYVTKVWLSGLLLIKPVLHLITHRKNTLNYNKRLTDWVGCLKLWCKLTVATLELAMNYSIIQHGILLLQMECVQCEVLSQNLIHQNSKQLFIQN